MCQEPITVSVMVTSDEYEDQHIVVELIPKPPVVEELPPPEPEHTHDMEM
jgi:hypothetical protein